MWKHQLTESHPTPVCKTILFVEDNPVLSKILKRTLESYTPHRIIHLSDGANILEKINEYRPDLLIFDYDLPGKNGIELYDLVHAVGSCEHIPVILLSAELPQQQLARRKLSSLSKPCKTSDLLRLLDVVLV